MIKKVVIEITEDAEGQVHCHATPSFTDMMEELKKNELPSPVIFYALGALNKIRDLSHEADKGNATVQMPMNTLPIDHTPDGVESVELDS